jgi:hypothetical protein
MSVISTMIVAGMAGVDGKSELEVVGAVDLSRYFEVELVRSGRVRGKLEVALSRRRAGLGSSALINASCFGD